MLAILRGIGLGLLLLVIVLIVRWPSLVALGVQIDLHEYARTIRASERTLEQKERLLDVIDVVEDRLECGGRSSMIRWKVHDDAIRAMLSDGISADEVRLIERELQQVERELNQ